MKKILIIDGHAFAFRAYYAFQATNLKNSLTGEPSGAVFGFFRMLFKILTDFSPTHFAIAFDPSTPLERNKLYPEYKANRKPTPEDLKPQIKQIIDICERIGFSVLKIDAHEADDIIGSITTQYMSKFDEILIFSGDKDMYQLLSHSHIKMLRGVKGASEFTIIDLASVPDIIGVTYKQVTDFMGIVGDTSDNIPGVKGIGEKGAAALLQEFKTLDAIYNNIDKVQSKSVKEKLIVNKENAFLSKKLATIKTDLNLHLTQDDLKLGNYLAPDKISIFQQEGFNVLYRDLSKQAGIVAVENTDAKTKAEITSKTITSFDASKVSYQLITDKKELDILIQYLSKQKIFCFDTETTSVDPTTADLLGISFSCKKDEAFYIPVAYSRSLFNERCLSLQEVIEATRGILENCNIQKIGQNIKYDVIVMEQHGVKVEGIFFDTMLASYVLEPEARKHNMDDLALEFLQYKTVKYSDLTGKGKHKKELYEIELPLVSNYSCEDADITFQLYTVFKDQLKDHASDKVFSEIEMPLVSVLKDMEIKGVKIDTKHFKKLSTKFAQKIEESESEIHTLAGVPFKVSSTKELQVVLFDKLKLPAEKRNLTGFSTDHSVLESLFGVHPIIEQILEYRKYSKLKSTYIDSLPKMIHPQTGRIHTSYNQTIAATGRLSSTDPNLQNIPIKDKEGKLIRQGFITESGYTLLSLDYSQIELRIMAHFSQDKNMIQSYKEGKDIHTATASAIFSVPESKVTADMRAKAKAINFSVIYGISPFGLSNSLKISRAEAKQFIDRYFNRYPGVNQFIETTAESCKKNGYVETMTGRRRYIPLIQSSRKQEQEAAIRAAVNSPIQGTSADMIKLAMIKIHAEIQKKKLKSSLIMQVHDELVFEVYEPEKEIVYTMAKSVMETILELSVPVVVQGSFGNNWDEAH
jgi:DNA polymerase I